MKDTIERTVSMITKQNIEKFDIYCVRSTGFSVDVKSGEVERLKVTSSEGIAIRVIIDGKLGFAYTSDTSEDGIKVTIECAKENAKNSEPDEYELSIPSESGLDFPLYDENYSRIEPSRKVEIAKELESAALSFDRRIKRVRRSSYRDSIGSVFYFNSNDNSFSYTTSSFSLSIMLMAEEGGSSQMGWDYDVRRYFRNLNAEDVGKTAAKSAVELLGARPIKSCRIPVIFENRVFAEIMEALSPVFLGNNVLRGKSLFADKLGSAVASHIFTIYDDPKAQEGTGSAPYDDEGTATKRKAVIERGELKQFLLDIYSAKKLGLKPTGNGIRHSISSTPQSGITNLVVERGLRSVEDIIREAEEVLLITDAMGIHTINPISGEFSIGISGKLFRNGEVVQPVTGCTVAGNIKELLNGVVEVGDDERWLGNVCSPSVLIRELSVSGI